MKKIIPFLFICCAIFALALPLQPCEGKKDKKKPAEKQDWFKIVSPKGKSKKFDIKLLVVCTQFESTMPEESDLMLLPANAGFYYSIVDDEKSNDLMRLTEVIMKGRVSPVCEIPLKSGDKTSWKIDAFGEGKPDISRLEISVSLNPNGNAAILKILKLDGQNPSKDVEVSVQNNKVLALTYMPADKEPEFGSKKLLPSGMLLLCKIIISVPKEKTTTREYRAGDLMRYFPAPEKLGEIHDTCDSIALASIEEALSAVIDGWDKEKRISFSKNNKLIEINQPEKIHEQIGNILKKYSSSQLVKLDIRYGLFSPEKIDEVKTKWFEHEKQHGVKVCILKADTAEKLFEAAMQSDRKTMFVERVVILPYEKYGPLESMRLADLGIMPTINPKQKVATIALDGIRHIEAQIIKTGTVVFHGLMSKNYMPAGWKPDGSTIPLLFIRVDFAK